MKVLAVTGIRSEYDILYPVLDESDRHQSPIAVPDYRDALNVRVVGEYGSK